MRTKASAKTPPPSRTHTVIIVLLMWVVALLVFGIGYLVYTKQQARVNTETNDVVAASCDDEVAAAVAAKTCPAPSVEKETYTDPFMPLTFQYPKGWHIYTFTDGGTGAMSLAMDENPISTCSECSGNLQPHGTINIGSRKLVTGETGKTIFAKVLADLAANPNVTITRQSESATGGVVAYTDTTPCDGVGCGAGSYELWYSSSATYLFTASLEGDTTEHEAVWTLFVSTVTTK